jgi:parallel beta-helix repeat protein
MLLKQMARVDAGSRRRLLLSSVTTIMLATASIVTTNAILSTGLARAQTATTFKPALPNRIFDMSQDQMKDFISEVQTLTEASASIEDLQRLRQFYRLAAQIKHYKAAMRVIGANADSSNSAKVTKFDDQLSKSGITSQSIALMGLRAIGRGDWSKLTTKEMEPLAVISAIFMEGVEEPALAALANNDLGKLYQKLGQVNVAFDRLREAVELTHSITSQGAKTETQIRLASSIVTSSDQRRFGLLTLLLKNSPAGEQEKIIDAISNGWSNDTSIAISELDEIAQAWALRIENHRKQVSGEKSLEQLAACASHVDTDICFILLAGRTEARQASEVDYLVQRYIQQDKGMRGVQLLSSLAGTAPSLNSYIELITYYSRHRRLRMVSDLTSLLKENIRIAKVQLSGQQQAKVSKALALAGLPDVLEELFAQRVLSEGNVDKGRNMAVSTLTRAIDAFGQGLVPPSISVNESMKDLQALTLLLDGRAKDIAPGIELAASADVELWVRAGEQLWINAAGRRLVVDFVNSAAPVPLKLALIRGSTGSIHFHLDQAAGKTLVQALRANAILQGGKVDQSADAILVAASVGEKSKQLGEDHDLHAEYTKRTLLFALQQNSDKDFLSQVEKARQIVNHHDRVLAFKALALARAEELDEAQWLSGGDATAQNKENREAVVALDADTLTTGPETPVVKENDHEAVLLGTAKRPNMPRHYPSSIDVYSRLPVPLEGAAGAAIGGESRVDRLTRFASEHYRGATNLGVREHIYAATGNITPKFIFLRGGVLSMGQLLAKIGHFNPDMIFERDGNIHLQVPLIIGPDATLVISGDEFRELRLSRQKGALIVNAGKLFFADAQVIGFDDVTGKAATLLPDDPGIDFRPFILSLSASHTYAAHSKFEALGYSAGSAYGFSLSSGPADEILKMARPVAPSGLIVDSSFENLYYGFYAFEAENVQLIGNEYRDGIVYGLDPHDRSNNLVMAFNSAYGTRKKHGIIISREVDDSFIIGNLSFDNAGTGVMLDRESRGTVVYANTLIGNKGDGFAALESPCALVSNNRIERNGRTGIKVRNSWDVQIDSNIVRQNKGAGIEAYVDRLEDAKGSEARNFKLDPYFPVSTLIVVRNQLQENATAIQTRGVAATTVFDNRFIKQAPKLFSGDAKRLSLEIFSGSKAQPVTVVSNCLPKITNRKACRLVEQGFMFGQSTSLAFKNQTMDPASCLSRTGELEILPVKKVN